MKTLAGRSFIFNDDEYFVEAKLTTTPVEIYIKKNKNDFNVIYESSYSDNLIYELIDTFYSVLSEENIKEFKICNITEKTQKFIINKAFFYRRSMNFLSFTWEHEPDALTAKYYNAFEEAINGNV